MFVVEVPPVPKPVEAVVIVDPFSTGASLAAHCYAMGYKIIAVYSAELDKLANLTNLIPQGLTLEFEAIIGFEADIGGMATKVRACGFPVMAIMAGAETGVELADALSSNMGLRSNGTAQSEARRNKFVMGETVRRAGVRAVKQKVVTEWQQVEAFLDEWQPNPFKVIVKPTESAGSEDVTLCLSPEELREAYHRIMGKVNGLGLVNKAVLVQEYLEGTEYVIDMVSVDGHHKVVAVWEYDKGPCNGAKFVMFGMRPLLATDDRIAEIIAYQKQVITALGVQHGPTHGEVKWFQDAPCLVEVGARCHGGEGTWLPVANAFYGYSQVEVTAAAYLNQSTFSAYPDNPVANISCGKILCLIVKVTGKLVEISPDLIEEMRQMRSFGRCEIYVKLGQDIVPTVNGFTFGGVVVLKHAEQAVVDADYARIREMEDQDLFVVA
ncbi:ddaF [Symbiodinium microadriaticum]|nr:ddaF [Symbiodinium microadriaticum]